MEKHLIIASAVIALLMSVAPIASADQIITLRSGNGSIGTLDSQITYLAGPADSSFAGTFNAASFAAADVGPSPWIISNHPAWIATLPADAAARWINPNQNGAGEGSSALYAINFTITDPLLSSATLNLNYAVDNQIGGGPNQGVFINGQAVSGSSTGGTFTSQFNLSRSDIAPLLQFGQNTLFINATDTGGPAGLIFSATISTVADPGVIIPLPASVWSGLALLTLAATLKSLRRRMPKPL